jgi:D-3-phosphoglycerate dehydrogenase
MPKIIVSDTMEEDVRAGLARLGDVVYQPADLKKELMDADVLIVRSATKVTAELIAGAPNLKVVARAGVGLDNVDAKACEVRGIKVINTPAASSNAVAELALAFMFCAIRKVPTLHMKMKQGTWAKKEGMGGELEGRTLGIIGFGRIGSILAKKASALGMRVLAYSDIAFSSEHAKSVPFEELILESDVISVHVPLTPQTKGMLNREQIGRMKNGVVLLNTARGGIIDEEALYEACKSGKVFAAALDVYAQEPYSGKLLELDNVVFTPHIGANTIEAQKRIGKELVEKLKAELGA